MIAMAKPKITFYVDIVSPFCYMAYYMVRHSPTFKSCDVTYVPILLGGLMNSCGNTAPLMIKNKDKWVGLERMRWATQFDIPMRKDFPPGFPVKTLPAQRMLTALYLQSPEKVPLAADRLYAALWKPDSLQGHSAMKDGNFDISKPDVITALLSDVLGKDLAAKIAEGANVKETKDALVANTNAAFKDGAFGLPWFHCTNANGDVEGFWGFDHIGQVVRFLGLDNEGDKGRSGQLLRAVL